MLKVSDFTTEPAQPMSWRSAKIWAHKLYVAGLKDVDIQPALTAGKYTGAYEIILTQPDGRKVSIETAALARSYVREREARK